MSLRRWTQHDDRPPRTDAWADRVAALKADVDDSNRRAADRACVRAQKYARQYRASTVNSQPATLIETLA